MSKENVTRNMTENKINESDAGVYAYDLALVEDLRARFSSSPVNSKVNNTVQIGSANNMFEILGTMNDDNVIMPFVSLERLSWNLNLDRQRFSNIYRR